MSTYKSITDVINEIENWLRLATLLHSGIEQALLSILHNEANDLTYNGLPKDPLQLYNELNTTHTATLTRLKNKKVISNEQLLKLLPVNGQTNSAELDTTLIVILIISCTNLPPPVTTGWNHKRLQAIDISKAAYVLRAREWRNYIHHTDPRDIDGAMFVAKWREGEDIITGLGYAFDSKTLKTVSLDPRTSSQQNLILNVLNQFCQREVNDHDKQLKTIVTTLNQSITDITQNKCDIDKHTNDIAKNTDNIAKNTEDIAKHTDNITKNTDNITKNTDDIAKNTDDITKNTDDIAKHTDDIAKNTDDIAKHTDDIAKNTDDIAKNTDNVAKNTDSIAKNTDDIAKNTDDIAKNTGNIAKNTDDITKIINVTQEIKNVVMKEQRAAQENLTEESIQATDPRVEVFTHFGNGCVLKFQPSPTDIIEKVMYKSVEEDSHWSEIQRKTTEDAETVCYQENITKENLVMLKVENLKERTKHRIRVETSGDQYNVLVTIYDKDECGHVIRADNKHFIVLAPPSGRLEDENCCKNGIKGKFVEKEMTLNVPISQGPIDGKMKVSEFTDFSNTYRNRNFPTTDDVIKFPPFNCIKDADVKRAAELFSEFLSMRKGLRAVVWNANSNKYLQRVLQSEVSLQMELTFDNRIMVYDDSTSSILNIRVMQQSGSMFNEMEHTITDLKSLVTSHRHSNPTCYCLGMLCFPNANRCEVESQMNFYFAQHDNQYADLFYICKEDLESLNKWWENVFEKELERLEFTYQCKRNRMEQNNNSFSLVLSECLATIAMVNTSTTPTLTKDTHLQIKTLLLNADQIRAIEHPSKRKLIQGNYGSGKSIVADEIFKQIYKKHRFERRKLFNIVWERYSLLEVYKHNLLQEMESTYPGCSDKFDVSIGTPNNLNDGKDISLLGFLTKQLEDNEIVDIIIDELPSEAIHESEVKILKKLLDDHPDSSVILIPQSVIVDRKKNNDSGKSINIGRNCLGKIELDEFTLSKTMRNSKQICAVLKCLQQQHMDSVLTIYEERSDQATSIPQKIRTIWKSITRKMKATLSEASTSESKEEITESRVTENAVDAQTKHLNPYFDKVAKHLHDGESKDSEKSIELLSSYRFFETKVGNQVNDHKPILVNLPSIFDVKKSGKLLAIALKEVCKLSPQTLIICNILEEIKMVSFSLSLLPECLHEIYIPQLSGYIPTIEEKRSLIYKFSEEKRIILLDNTAAKGIESRNVIIFIEKHEHFLRHEIVETLARANISCYIVMYTSSDSTQHGENTIGTTLSLLIRNRLVEQIEVKSEEDHTNFDKSHRLHGNNFIINDVYCRDNMNTSFDTFLEKFNENYPILSKELSYRDDLENLTKAPLINHIVHEVEHDGHTYKFRDVLRMLHDKDFRSFESIIDVDPNIINNLRDGFDYTLLMEAIAIDHVDIVEYLTSTFTEQIDYMARNRFGWTAFHDAARCNNIDAMNILIAKDRRGLESRDDYGETPLFYAASKNNKSMVKLLLNNGVDPHAKRYNDLTADQQYGVDKDIQIIIRDYQTKNASTGTSS